MLSLDDISVFVSVVERRNFSAAAREMKLSPSAVSKRINRLEHELRAKLINRSSRRVALTAAGLAFFEKCAGIRPLIEDASRAVQSMHSAPGGRLRVHAHAGLAGRLIAPLIPEFLSLYPDISIDLAMHITGPTVITENVDLFINTSRTLDKSLGYREIGTCHYTICATPAYLRQAGCPKSPRELSNHNCLLYLENGQLVDRWSFADARRRYNVAVHGNFSCNNSASLYEALLRDGGIALLPVYAVCDDVRAGNLVALFRDELAFERKLRAVYPRTPHLPVNTRLFLDFVADHVERLTLETTSRRAAAASAR